MPYKDLDQRVRHRQGPMMATRGGAGYRVLERLDELHDARVIALGIHLSEC